MTWRTVVIENKAKLSYKNDYLIVRGEKIKTIHLSEISTIIIDNTAVTLTSYLISELLDRKIKLVFCDHQRNPQGEVLPYYGCHNSSKKIQEQLNWDSQYSGIIWTRIIYEKIMNQANLLKEIESDRYKLLYNYLDQLTILDETNREGYSAKIYFNTLFGMDFSREQDNDINIMLNYGYSILLSQFNKEIAANGCLTQLGIKHKNEFNPFNLSSDLMEPFRPIVDRLVYELREHTFNGNTKLKLLQLLNKKVVINDSSQYLPNAISIYVKSVIEALKNKDMNLIKFVEYEL